MSSPAKSSEPTIVLRVHDVAKMLNVSIFTLYRWMRIGRFPRGAQYGPRVVGWNRSTVDAWLRSNVPPTLEG